MLTKLVASFYLSLACPMYWLDRTLKQSVVQNENLFRAVGVEDGSQWREPNEHLGPLVQ